MNGSDNNHPLRASAPPRELDDITGAIVDASLKIHRELGPGLLELLTGKTRLIARGEHGERKKG